MINLYYNKQISHYSNVQIYWNLNWCNCNGSWYCTNWWIVM